MGPLAVADASRFFPGDRLEEKARDRGLTTTFPLALGVLSTGAAAGATSVILRPGMHGQMPFTVLSSVNLMHQKNSVHHGQTPRRRPAASHDQFDALAQISPRNSESPRAIWRCAGGGRNSATCGFLVSESARRLPVDFFPPQNPLSLSVERARKRTDFLPPSDSAVGNMQHFSDELFVFSQSGARVGRLNSRPEHILCWLSICGIYICLGCGPEDFTSAPAGTAQPEIHPMMCLPPVPALCRFAGTFHQQ